MNSSSDCSLTTQTGWTASAGGGAGGTSAQQVCWVTQWLAGPQQNQSVLLCKRTHTHLELSLVADSFSTNNTPCSEKNILDIFDCDLKKDYRILIIFDVNISDTTGEQMTVRFSTAPIVCFCTTWGNKINEIAFFDLFHLFTFVRVVQKQTFGEVGTKTVIWWQVVSKMFAPKIKICQSFFKSQAIMLGMLFDVFWFISTHILLVLFSPGSAETDVGWGRILNDHLMASWAKNIGTKNYYKCIFVLQVTIDNVRDVFFRTRCIALSVNNYVEIWPTLYRAWIRILCCRRRIKSRQFCLA